MQKIKVILVSLLIVTNFHGYSQKIDSKILAIINDGLKIKSLYFIDYDTLLKIRGIQAISDSELVLVDKKHTLFNKYTCDSIHFYFGNKKLNKCVWYFAIEKNEDETMGKLLTKKFGTSGYDRGADWVDDYSKLTLILDSVAEANREVKSYTIFHSAFSNKPNPNYTKVISKAKGNFHLEFKMFQINEISQTPKSITMISYKFEKVINGKIFFGGRIVQSIRTEYTKFVPTKIKFDFVKNTVQIANKVWEIISHDDYNYHATTGEIHVSSHDTGDDIIFVEHNNNGGKFKYHIKPSQWKFP